MTDPARTAHPTRRRPWTAPAITPLRSRHAHGGANPANPEGAFAEGS